MSICITIIVVVVAVSLYFDNRRADRQAQAPDPNTCTPWQRVRQFFRRWVWGLLFVPGVLSYPLQMDLLVRYLLRQVPKGDYAQALDATYAKLVDPLFFYSKVSIAIGMFFLINWLAWAALNLAMPVLPDWAKGWYKQPRADYGVRSGFKGTFLGDGVSDTARLAFFFVGFGLELAVAWGSVDASFRIQ
jgi:hypothetical protein